MSVSETGGSVVLKEYTPPGFCFAKSSPLKEGAGRGKPLPYPGAVCHGSSGRPTPTRSPLAAMLFRRMRNNREGQAPPLRGGGQKIPGFQAIFSPSLGDNRTVPLSLGITSLPKMGSRGKGSGGAAVEGGGKALQRPVPAAVDAGLLHLQLLAQLLHTAGAGGNIHQLQH